MNEQAPINPITMKTYYTHQYFLPGYPLYCPIQLLNSKGKHRIKGQARSTLRPLDVELRLPLVCRKKISIHYGGSYAKLPPCSNRIFFTKTLPVLPSRTGCGSTKAESGSVLRLIYLRFITNVMTWLLTSG